MYQILEILELLKLLDILYILEFLKILDILEVLKFFRGFLIFRFLEIWDLRFLSYLSFFFELIFLSFRRFLIFFLRNFELSRIKIKISDCSSVKIFFNKTDEGRVFYILKISEISSLVKFLFILRIKKCLILHISREWM